MNPTKSEEKTEQTIILCRVLRIDFKPALLTLYVIDPCTGEIHEGYEGDDPRAVIQAWADDYVHQDGIEADATWEALTTTQRHEGE